MASTTVPAPTSKTRYVVTLLSGTSWTVPTGCTYINATLIGAGAGGGNSTSAVNGMNGQGGQIVVTNLATTPAASITYAIGAGGATSGGAGGSTTMTGCTTGAGGLGANNVVGTAGMSANNGGGGGIANASSGGVGGAGKIEIEYWA